MTSYLFELEILKASRTRLLRIIETLDHDLLFEIPKNFNNNIIWQIGHCITSQQRHMYMRSGLPMHISLEFMESFKIGTNPHLWKAEPEVDEIKYLLLHTVEKLYTDLESKIFIDYTSFSLPNGLQINNHLQALQAANIHEAEHSGIILSYIKLLER